MSLESTAEVFLAHERIAVVGASRGAGTGNGIFKTLRAWGKNAVPVNPSASEVAGAPCYPDLGSIPGGVDAVVIVTPSGAAESVIRECIALGIRHVWMHHNALFGARHSSVSAAAVELGRENGLEVIAGGCPLMFGDRADLGHKCMRWLLGVARKLPDAA